MPQSKAAQYTHSFDYRQLDSPGDTLTATVTFEDTQNPGSTVNQDFNSNFIKNITMVYTPSGQSALTISYSDFTDGGEFDKYTFVPSVGSVNFADSSEDALYDQLSNLQFGQGGGAFNLTINVNNFRVDASDGSTTTDFILEGSSYVSPAPVPLLGLIPAFSAISRLKRRYKLKNNA